MRKAFIATVQLLIEADEEGYACDAVSELLSNERNEIIDWGYIQVGGQYLSPAPKVIPDAEHYEEGAFMN